MTSFERFQRHQRSQQEFSQMKGQPPQDYTSVKLRELVTFSQKQLIFNYSKHNQTCKSSLKISNMSGFRVHFKVRSNNPTMYRVTPHEEIIQDQQQITISFEYQIINKSDEFMNKQNPKKDKFEIVWGKLSNNPGERTVLSQSKILNVQIVMVPENGLQSKNSSREQIGYYDASYPTSSLNVENKGNPIYQNYPGSENHKDTLLNKNIIIGVSAVSFLLGFILS